MWPMGLIVFQPPHDGMLAGTMYEIMRMAAAMRDACAAGRQAHLAGRIPRRLYANASSPEEGLIEEAGPRP